MSTSKILICWTSIIYKIFSFQLASEFIWKRTMAPKKKGKGSKLSRMTEEERARYLQHRAAIEEEARQCKQQLIATFMKVRLWNIPSILTAAVIYTEWKPDITKQYRNLLSVFQIQNKLKHEEAFTRLNLAKINQQWRHILRQIKTKEMKQDVEVNKIMKLYWQYLIWTHINK